MFATTSIPQSTAIEQFRAIVENLGALFAKQGSRNAVEYRSATFTPSRQPLSPEVLREVERLELAIRQGSVNA